LKRTHRKIKSGTLKRFVLGGTMASTLGSGSKHATHFNKPEIDVASLEDFQKILDSEEIDLSEFSEDMAFSGFDKAKFGRLAAKRLGAYRTVKLCLLGGMRGTNLKKIMDKSVKVDSDVVDCYKTKKILSKGTGSDDLTMGRLLAVFPEIAAHYMSQTKIQKKIVDCDCPASLQFPAAAGLPMSPNVRIQHLEFAIRFSQLISGDKKFHPEYYKAAFNGQQDVSRLSVSLQKICGNPITSDSRAFDIDAALQEAKKKFGADKFAASGGGVSV
jgi:hypothetical protein